MPSIKNYVDFITLASFDVYTPERNPKGMSTYIFYGLYLITLCLCTFIEADYVAPTLSVTDRNVDQNVDFASTYLVANGYAGNKIVVGLATYGRAWKIEKDATITGAPPGKFFIHFINKKLTYYLYSGRRWCRP